jgi:serine/threonine-protein kinase
VTFGLALLLAASVVSGGALPAPEQADEPACAPPEPGFLTLDTAPWTQVYVDGAYVGSTPLYRHKLPPGPHTLTLVNEGKQVKSEEEVVIDEGHLRKMRLILAVDEDAAALDDSGAVSTTSEDCIIPEEQAAALTVDTQPWSRVYVDGRLVGSTPLYKTPILAGPHVVRLVRDDGKAAFARVTASAGEVIKLSFALAGE